jgi:hypothetical protein
VRRRKTGEGGEQNMMKTVKITRIFIDKVAIVEIDKLGEESAFDFTQRTITITTEEGDKYEFILEAASTTNLKLLEVSDWLNPKVYKGKEE